MEILIYAIIYIVIGFVCGSITLFYIKLVDGFVSGNDRWFAFLMAFLWPLAFPFLFLFEMCNRIWRRL